MLTNIQLLRTFAATAVVVFHALETLSTYGFNNPGSHAMRSWGQCGVDVFFVISGFIIAYTHQKRPKTGVRFIAARLIRVVPIYWFFTFTFIGLLAAFPGLAREATLTAEKTFYSVSFTSFLFRAFPYLFVGWTLEYELIFYILFGLSTISWQATQAQPLRPFVYTSVGIICVASFFHPIALEFIFGLVIGVTYRSKKEQPSKQGVWVLIVGMLLLASSLFFHAEPWRVVFWGLPSALVVFGALHARQSGNRLLIHLGNASYCTYLVQVFTIPAFGKAIALFMPGLHWAIAVSICTLVALVAGSITHVGLERPLQRVLRRRLLGPPMGAPAGPSAR